MFENKEKKEIKDLGEFGLIKHLTQHFSNVQSNTLKGVGDDAAVIEMGNQLVLVTNDILLEGIHFDFSYTPIKHLGYKAIASNISDIVAMNGTPTQVLVSIGLSSKMTLEAVEELYIGIKAACEHYHVDLVGGDTSSSKQGTFISVTALGTVLKEDITYRSGAKENDLVCVTGDLGAAYTGYMLLEREKRIFLDNPQIQPDMEGHDYILQRQLRPEARLDIVKLLKELNIKPTAMMDISDGLSSELLHISEQSGVGFTIYEDKIPIDPTTFQTARDLGLDPTVCALSGGEDYELIFTISQNDYEKLKFNPDITIVGHACAMSEGLHLISNSNNKYPLSAQGWNAVS